MDVRSDLIPPVEARQISRKAMDIFSGGRAGCRLNKVDVTP